MRVQVLLRRRWPSVLLGATLLAGGARAGFRMAEIVRGQLPELLRTRLEAALGRPVTFGALRIGHAQGAPGVWVESLRVARRPGEPADPLTARGLRVGLDWYALLTRGQVRPTELELDRARLQLFPGAVPSGRGPWTAQVADLSRTGVDRLSFRQSEIRFLSAGGWSAEGLDGALTLAPARFGYTARARRLSAGGAALADVRLAGAGDAGGVAVRQASAGYQGGVLTARGSVSAASAALLTVRVERIPLSRLAPAAPGALWAAPGLPAEWAVTGHVTGEMTVDARNGALRGIRGELRLDRGGLNRGSGELPWQSARAKLDWTPERTRLRDVRVSGAALELSARGEVATPGGRPFLEGSFQASGEMRATSPGSVRQVASLLAFSPVMGGRWEAAGASVAFRASGTTGDLARAAAGGRLRVEDLRFQPVAGGDTVRVMQVTADVTRSGDRLELRHLEARTEKLLLAGAATLLDDRPGRAGEVRAEGRVEAADLRSLRQAVPQSPLWRWLPALSAASSGALEFRVAIPTASPRKLVSEGAFTLRRFRLGARSPLPNGAYFFIPVESASGTFRHAAERLTLSGLKLRADTFQAGGSAELSFAGRKNDPLVDARLHVAADDWRALPAVPAGALPELQGGRMEGEVRLAGSYSGLAQAPVSGSFRITDASYQAQRPGVLPVPVRSLEARFNWRSRVLELPQVRLDTTLFQATARGDLHPDGDGYRLALDVEATSDDAGTLAALVTESGRVTGGKGTLTAHLELPVEHVEATVVTGRLAVSGARLAVPEAGFPLGEGLRDLLARELEVNFERGPAGWKASRVALDTDSGRLLAEGGLTPERIDAQVDVRLTRWTAPAALPFSGGVVTLRGRVSGPLAAAPGALWALGFRGEVTVEGARPALRGEGLALTGGTLSVRAAGEGPLSDSRQWLRRAEVSAAGPRLALAERAPVTLQRAAAVLVREGDGFRVESGEVRAEGLEADFSGAWSESAHRLALRAAGRDLARWGVTLPAGAAVTGFRLSGEIAGGGGCRAHRAPGVAVTSARGRLELDGTRLPLPNGGVLALARLGGGFAVDGGTIKLEEWKGEGPAGTLSLAGSLRGGAHSLTVRAAGGDVKLLGLHLPEGFSAARYRLEAEFAGTAKEWARTGRGTLALGEVRFPFGPGAAHHIEKATSRFTLAGGVVRLEGLEAEGPAGRFEGGGELRDGAYRLELTAPRADATLARWLVPGQVRGGSLSGSLRLDGRMVDGTAPVQSASGRFELRDAAYTLPAELELKGPEARITRFAGQYRWRPEHTELTGLSIESDLLTGEGTLRITAGEGEVRADLKSADLGRVSDFWPSLRTKMRGGVASGRLEARFGEQGLRGTLALRSTGGALVLPSVPEEYREHPVQHARLVLGFAPGKLTFGDVELRGPKGNLDGEGTWSDVGPVYGKGRAWLAKDYTKKLLKPSGWGWLAKLVGVREIKSDFAVGGTAERVSLQAGITRSMMWKFARGRVPKEFQAIAAGKNPLWVRPLEVAAAPPAAAARTSGSE